jgi:hypothetical protein
MIDVDVQVQLDAVQGPALPLGATGLVAGSLQSLDGLVAGTDYTADLALGTVVLLRPVGRTHVSFRYRRSVPDPVPVVPLDFGTDATDLGDRLKIQEVIDAFKTYLASGTATQAPAALKAVMRVQIAILRRLL